MNSSTRGHGLGRSPKRSSTLSTWPGGSFATPVSESDDYSHDLSKTDFAPNDKITLYYKDKLAQGVEP